MGNEPDATLFIALKTNKNDGANYIPQLVEQGVKAFVVEQSSIDQIAEIAKIAQLAELVFLVVKDSLVALQQLAAYKRSVELGKA